jgi:hypothetical protein
MPPPVTSNGDAEGAATTGTVVSRHVSEEARRGMALEPLARKEFRMPDLPGFAGRMGMRDQGRPTSEGRRAPSRRRAGAGSP